MFSKASSVAVAANEAVAEALREIVDMIAPYVNQRSVLCTAVATR